MNTIIIDSHEAIGTPDLCAWQSGFCRDFVWIRTTNPAYSKWLEQQGGRLALRAMKGGTLDYYEFRQPLEEAVGLMLACQGVR